MKKTIITGLIGLLFSAASATAAPAPSILEIKHSISDDNIVPPHSFETSTRELEENFYLKNFVVPGVDLGNTKAGTPVEYEERLKRLPTVVELPYNSIVGNYINMYLGKRRGLVADMLALHSYYGPIFVEELLKAGVPTELQYLPVIESAINPTAVSPAGAMGLWQFMPATAKGLGMEVNSLVDERCDTRLASRNAAKFLKQLFDIYGDWSLAIAAYNCGPGNVNKALRRAGGEGKKDFWEIYSFLPQETRGYVPAFIAANYVMNYYGNHGISPTVVKRHLTTDTVVVNKYIHFNQIAAVLNIPVEEIRMLNPQFRKDIIPGDYRPYILTLPTQQCLSYVMSEKRIADYDSQLYARRSYVEPNTGTQKKEDEPADDGGQANKALAVNQTANAESNNVIVSTQNIDKATVKHHTVARGENLRDIAKMYGVSATDIKRWNQLRQGKVKEGDVLTIEVYERVQPDNVKVVATPEVAQVSPQELRGDSQPVQTGRQSSTPPAVTTKQTQTSSQSQSAKQTQTGKRAANAKTTANNAKKTQAKPSNHKVNSGESLEKISKKYGVSVAELQAANGMKKDQTTIRIGQSLKIPAKKAAAKNSKNSKGTSNKKRR